MILCSACQSQDHKVLIDNLTHKYVQNEQAHVWRYRLLECQNCGLGFVDPMPTWQVLQTFYSADYGSYDPKYALPEQEAHSLKYRLARWRFAYLRAKNIRTLSQTALGMLIEGISGKTVSFTLGIPLQLDQEAQIFELGYGSGNWLLAMARIGYRNLYGYDIDVNAEHAQRLRQHGISISSGIFLENDYPDATFDCIRLEHVFEHLLEPVAVLRKCHAMLKPGGYIVMNFPYKDSWSMNLGMEYSPLLQLPKHLYHHSRRSTEKMLYSAGFESLHLNAYPVFSVLVTAASDKMGWRRIADSQRVLPLFAPLYGVICRGMGIGEFLTVYARRETC